MRGTPVSGRRALRRELRAMRMALPAADRIAAAFAVAQHLLSSELFAPARRVAAYVAVNGELDPGPFIATARELGRRIHLPVLPALPRGGLRFAPVEADDALRPNRYGIPEPRVTTLVRPAFLDLVLVPLVAFDGAGNRLGMGAGHYDRTFGFRRLRSHWRGPRLVGLAYDGQRVEHLDPEPWDVPLDAVVTESGLWRFE